ncbi:diguanylate cyclase [Desulfosporosinus sp. PR]|uniref:diguanylate cyclase n=1 Tax=Candidatus Desulfosporosinus nitrosoreducens TaxID=3401928 RepID=UPI0027F9F68E|nr:diguanylate cyclase [Desulfosporosinus sp. PR]MDQ7093524.1 diguanylate cyclase [Desulfosporosinus sp. PR]
MKVLIRKHISRSTLLVFVFLMLFSTAQYVSAAPIQKNVLVIHPYTAEFPAHQAFNTGLKTKFAEDKRYGIDFSYEYLDMQKFSHSEAYLEALASYFKLKQEYSNWQPDVIVASDVLAPFLMKYGSEIFNNVPIIMTWAADVNPPANLPADYVVLPAVADFADNIRLILETQRKVKKIYIVIGDSENEKITLSQIQKESEPFSSQVELVYLNKLPYLRMLERLQQAGDDSAILFVRWVRDVAGESFVPFQVLSTITKKVSIPVYGTQMQYLGSGIIGGYVYNNDLTGRNVAEIALRIFDGEKPAQLTRTNIRANEYAFDWRALERWNIAESKLPSEARIEYRENDFWSTYKLYIIIGGIIIFGETVLIVGFITSHRKRRKAENELLKFNNSLEKLVDERTRELQTAKEVLEDLNQRLEFTARVDALTGLYNRRHIEERLKEDYEIFIRTGREFSVMLADIDFFKRVNDEYGHDAGDSVLKTLSNTIRAMVRDYDVIARWGGEEFLLLFPGLTNADAAERAEVIRKAIEEYNHTYNGRKLLVTLTIGVATIGRKDTIDDLIKRADDALYQGKNTGKNKVVIAPKK